MLPKVLVIVLLILQYCIHLCMTTALTNSFTLVPILCLYYRFQEGKTNVRIFESKCVFDDTYSAEGLVVTIVGRYV